MRKVNWIVLLLFVFVITSAFTWPWDKKDEPVVEEAEVVEVEVDESKPADDRGPADVLLEDYNLEKKEMTQEEKDALEAKMTHLTNLAKTPAAYPKTVKVTTPTVVTPVRAAVLPKTKAVSSGVAAQSVAPVIMGQKPTASPNVMKRELNQVIQYNKRMKAELGRQMDMLNQNLRMAKTYNKILNNMYPVSAGRKIADQAVDQEKMRIIHEEIKGLTNYRTPPAIEIKKIKARAEEVKITANEAKRSAVLPIGKNAPKA